MFATKLRGLYAFMQSLFVKNYTIDPAHLPRHIGIIMDGNGRWAKRRGLPRKMGHRAGAETLQSIVTYASDIGIEFVTVYAFSTENWKRPKDEVDALMDLLFEYLSDMQRNLKGKDNVIRIIGDVTALRPNLQALITQLEKNTRDKKGLVLNIALNYGGRDEITAAAKAIAIQVKNGEVIPDSIDAQLFDDHLCTAGQPDVDLLIRPSGEMRLSNFLLWQCAYAEFWFSDICWPDFTYKHLNHAIYDFQKRHRRFGGV